MYREALFDAAEKAIESVPIDDIAKHIPLPKAIIKLIFHGLKTQIIKLSEDEAQKVLHSFFDIVDAFRERLTGKAVEAISGDKEDSKSNEDNGLSS